MSVGCSSDGAAVAHNAKNRAVTVVLALKEGAEGGVPIEKTQMSDLFLWLYLSSIFFIKLLD